MGWWGSDKDDDGVMGIVWGDHPADILDEAIHDIVATFREDWNRNPTYQEMISGFDFSMCSDNEKEWTEFLEEHDPWTQVGLPKTVGSLPGLFNAIPE